MIIAQTLHLSYSKLFLAIQKTHAYHRMTDDVPEEVKKARLQELITTFHSIAAARNQRFIGSEQLVLVEKVNLHSNINTTSFTEAKIDFLRAMLKSYKSYYNTILYVQFFFCRLASVLVWI